MSKSSPIEARVSEMKVLASVTILILAIILIVLFRPNDQGITPVDNKAPAFEPATMPIVVGTVKSAEDLRIERMTTAYEILEQERAGLKRRLARLRHDMWDMKFAPETVGEINDILLSAHKLLKNPAMLGAFHNEDAIDNEIAKVDFADKSLQRVIELIQAGKDSDAE